MSPEPSRLLLPASEASEAERRARFEHLGALAAGLAHDLGNVLTSVAGYTSAARASIPPGGDGGDYLRRAEEASSLAIKLCRYIADCASSTGSSHSQCDINTIARATIRIIRDRFSAAKIQVNLTGGDLFVWSDPIQTSRIVLNLATNAAQALPPRGGCVCIRTACEEVVGGVTRNKEVIRELADGSYVRLDVEDDGEGIPLDARGRVFSGGYTTKIDGHGVGLASTLDIVRRAHGAILLRSEVGIGSCFSVFLPFAGSTEAIHPFPALLKDKSGSRLSHVPFMLAS